MLRLLLSLAVLSAGFAMPPDGTGPSKSWRLAYVYKGDIWTADGNGRNRKLLVKNGSSPCWSPDKKRVAFARAGDIWVVGIADRIAKRLTVNWKPAKTEADFQGGREVDIAWDPKSGNLYFSHWEMMLIRRPEEKTAQSVQTCTIFELSPNGGKPKPRLDLFEHQARFRSSVNGHPAFSRNGNLMAFIRNGDIWLADRLNEKDTFGRDSSGQRWDAWDMIRLDASASYDAPNYRGSRWILNATHISLDPDGTMLVFGIQRINGTGSRGLVLLKFKTERGSHEVTSDENMGTGLEPCFSPDGKWIAYEGNEPNAGIYAMQVVGDARKLLIPEGREPAW